MARRRRSQQSISLFPFLSILACVIGTLTLMITAMALGQMDNDTVLSAERFEKVRRRLEEERRLGERLKRELEEVEAGADERMRQIADAKVRVEELQVRRDALLEEADRPGGADIDVPIVDEEKHRRRMDAIRREQETVDEELARLRAEMGDRVGEERQVVIEPGGSGLHLEPTFVECTAGGLVLLEEDPARRVPRADMASDEAFLALLERVSQRPKGIVIFLVREDALPVYFAARDLAYANYAKNGKLPVVGQGRIDLSVFRKGN